MRCQIVFTDPSTKVWSVNDIKQIDEIGGRFGMSDADMDRMEAAIDRGEYFTLPDRRFAAYPLDSIPGQVPEVIEGLEQYRAGHGGIVTEWHETRDAAVDEFCRLRPTLSCEDVFDLCADREEFVRRQARLLLPRYRDDQEMAALFAEQACRNYDVIAHKRQLARAV